jgi:hypothetical protein
MLYLLCFCAGVLWGIAVVAVVDRLVARRMFRKF